MRRGATTTPRSAPSPAGGHGPDSDHSDFDLLRLVAQRRAHALSKLYDRHSRMLLALSLRMLGNRADAEDVLQEVFIYVWRRAGHYLPYRSSVSTWLVLIARSRTLDRLRTMKRFASAISHREWDELVKIESPATVRRGDGLDHVLSQERSRRIRRAMAKLPPAQRQVLELAYFDGLTQTEVAEKTGIPIGTVKSRTLLAVKKLRRELAGGASPSPTIKSESACHEQELAGVAA